MHRLSYAAKFSLKKRFQFGDFFLKRIDCLHDHFHVLRGGLGFWGPIARGILGWSASPPFGGRGRQPRRVRFALIRLRVLLADLPHERRQRRVVIGERCVSDGQRLFIFASRRTSTRHTNEMGVSRRCEVPKR